MVKHALGLIDVGEFISIPLLDSPMKPSDKFWLDRDVVQSKVCSFEAFKFQQTCIWHITYSKKNIVILAIIYHQRTKTYLESKSSAFLPDQSKSFLIKPTPF